MENNKVYCHINKINGKRYIGITKQSLTERFQNGLGYRKCTAFYNAIQKYGWDNFEHVLLADNLTREEASQLEQSYIEYYQTNQSQFGYNISSGGDNNFHRKHLTEEQRQRVSETTKIAMNTSEMKEKMRKVCYESDSWKEKQSNKAKNQWKNTDLRAKVVAANGKKVRCIETGIIYDSAAEASRQTGLNKECIGNCCRGTQHQTKGTHWEFV